MEKLINVETLINNFNKYLIIDLRSPLEYEKGTIRGAINIPLLDNEERKIVGTLYKEDQKKAYEMGLEVGSSKLPKIYEQVNKLKEKNPGKEIVFFCFRGGTRSKSVQRILELLKISSYKLDGGYKAYRKYVLDNLPFYLNKINWVVLTGNTGTGKTVILQELLNNNYPVIDLEQMANNRGSIFGSVGLNQIINQRDFDSELFLQLKNYVDNNIFDVLVECESKRIGNVYLPFDMYDKMQLGKHLIIERSVNKRIEIITSDYNPTNISKEEIKKLVISNEYFKKVLGIKWVNQMLDYIEEFKYDDFIKRMLIDYYDKLYLKSQVKHNYDLVIKNDDNQKVIEQVKEYYDNIKRKNG